MVLVAAALASGCSAARGAVRVSAPLPDRSADPANVQRLQALVAARQVRTEDSNYVIATGDLLSVTIHGYRPGGGDFSTDVRVDGRGYVNLPMLPPIQASKRDLAGFREDLIQALRSAEIMRQPMVSVFLKEYQGRGVLVFGAVARAGMYHLSRGQETIIDLLSMTGGLTDGAGNYIILRPYERGGDSDGAIRGEALQTVSTAGLSVQEDHNSIVLRMDSAAELTQSLLESLPVRDGDVIVVPAAGQVFIEGAIDKAGLYPLHHGMTLSQLIATAGGTTFPAKRNDIRLVRSAARTDAAQWLVDLDAIQEQKLADILLEPNDRVVVPATAPKQFVYGFYRLAVAIVHIGVGGTVPVF